METTRTTENLQNGNLIAPIPGRMLKLLTNPVQFFSSDMPKRGGYAEPLVFMVVMALATALVLAATGLLGIGSPGMMGMGYVGVIMLPVMVAIFGFVSAAILFVIWKIMGSKENYETAYRCVAYGYACAPVAALFSGVPYLGILLSSLWPMVLMAIASIHVHGRSSTISWAVFGILGLFLALMGLGAEMVGGKMEESAQGWSGQLEERFGNPDEMTPEQAGEVLGEMLKGFNQGQQ